MKAVLILQELEERCHERRYLGNAVRLTDTKELNVLGLIDQEAGRKTPWLSMSVPWLVGGDSTPRIGMEFLSSGGETPGVFRFPVLGHRDSLGVPIMAVVADALRRVSGLPTRTLSYNWTRNQAGTDAKIRRRYRCVAMKY